jgi:hypothetical protein
MLINPHNSFAALSSEEFMLRLSNYSIIPYHTFTRVQQFTRVHTFTPVLHTFTPVHIHMCPLLLRVDNPATSNESTLAGTSFRMVQDDVATH